MKKLTLLIIAGFVMMSFSFQNGSDKIINALKQGSSEEFSSYFDNLLDIKLPEKEEIKNIGKTQAGIVMKTFFEQNAITSFDVTSQRELSGTMYITGKLTGDNKNYNLTVMMKNRGDKLSVITVRIS
jgi:hypothetical protein